MRRRRIKVAAETGEAVYHCMTRTVNGERLFDDVAREVLRKQLWQVADYCGVAVITYAILSNHFHVLVRVPQRTTLSDVELLRRYSVLYPTPTRYQVAQLHVVREQLRENGAEAQAWRKRQLALMGDVSQFMKLLKQRFAIWFNQTHQRFGTLWCERFKSVLVEPRGRVLQTMAAYIDLNGVRAGFATDPKEYRFCGYAEAVAGSERARAGLRSIGEGCSWTEAHAGYRKILFGTGAGPRANGGSIPPEEFRRVLKEGGQLPLAAVLRCRVRYFSDGAVLGSRAFVAEYLAKYRKETGRRKDAAPNPVPPVADWGELTTLRGLRRETFG